MGPAIIGCDLHQIRCIVISDVVSSSHYIKLSGIFSTVSSSENKVISDESSSTEPGVINHQSNYPGPLVLLSLESSNNSLTSRVMSIILNTTNIIKVPQGSFMWLWKPSSQCPECIVDSSMFISL